MAVAFNEDAARLGQHAARQGYAGLSAEGPSSLARDCNVLQQSSWVAIGRDGAIVGRRGDGADGRIFLAGRPGRPERYVAPSVIPHRRGNLRAPPGSTHGAEEDLTALCDVAST